MNDSVERIGDMHHRKALHIHAQRDGDIVVSIMSDHGLIEGFGSGSRESRTAEVEFCTTSSGGGRSQHTREALIQLMRAMERDNEEENPPALQPIRRPCSTEKP